MTNAGRWSAVALTVLAAAGARVTHAEEGYSTDFTSEARLGGDVAVLRARVPFARVRVVGSNRADVLATARVELHHPLKGRAQEIVREAAGVVLRREGESIHCTVEVLPPGEPDDVQAGASVAVELDIEMPRQLGVDIISQFGDVDVFGVTGPIGVSARSGAISVRSSPGSANLAADFGKVTVWAGGDVNVVGRNAEVQVSGARSVYVENLFGQVSVSEVAGDVRIEASNGEIAVEDVGGAIEIDNSFGPVEIRGSGGAVHVQTTGAISVSEIDSIPDGSQWLLSTQFHPVVLTLAESADVEVRARSHFGPVESDFEMAQEHGWDEEGTVRLGEDGRARIEIRNTEAIRIVREKEGE